MSITLFIQEEFADYNFEREYSTFDEARTALFSIKGEGGYWSSEAARNGKTETIFIPWHKVNYAKITVE